MGFVVIRGRSWGEEELEEGRLINQSTNKLCVCVCSQYMAPAAVITHVCIMLGHTSQGWLQGTDRSRRECPHVLLLEKTWDSSVSISSRTLMWICFWELNWCPRISYPSQGQNHEALVRALPMPFLLTTHLPSPTCFLTQTLPSITTILLCVSTSLFLCLLQGT